MNSKQAKSQNQMQPKNVDVNHYFRLLYEKKYWIFSSFAIGTIVWLFLAPSFVSNQQSYDFYAVIRMEEPRTSRSATGVDESYTEVEATSKVRIIQTRQFLVRVIDSLNLNVLSRTPGLSREKMFSKIVVGKNFKTGGYLIENKNGSINLYYTNRNEGFENHLLSSYQTTSDSILSIEKNGLILHFNLGVLEEREEIKFSVVPHRSLIQGLQSNIEPQLNRRGTLLTIHFSSPDPLLGVNITNTLAEFFLKQSLEFKQSKTTSVMNILEEQLRVSKKELENVEQELRKFREQNPHIYLSTNLAEYNRRLTDSESEVYQINNNITQVEQLLSAKSAISNVSERHLLYQQILVFLEERNVAGISALNQQYSNDLSNRQQLLNDGFSEDHQRIKEADQLLSSHQANVDRRVQQYLTTQKGRREELQKTAGTIEERLRLSPRRELTLAKLQRERDAKSNVYSNILLRYNEVKVAHASITPDAWLIERADVPIVYTSLMDQLKFLIKRFLIGPVLGLFLSLGIIIGIDLIWHRARSVDDLENILEMPVLSTIPIIKNPNGLKNTSTSGEKMDSKLVTIDYSPSIESESFRNLRTKLILNDDEGKHRQFVITSLLPGDGKSLVAGNLAITFAQLKHPTLLIDCDLRRGVLHNSFACKKKPGLTDYLSKPMNDDLESVSSIIQNTTIPNLHLISGGTNIPNPTELLINKKFETILNLLKQRFQYIICDSPPIEFIPDAFVLNKQMHSMVLVTRYAKTDINKLKRKISEVSDMEQDFAGIVLNASVGNMKKNYYTYSYYKY